MTTPGLKNIDHIHVYVSERTAAESWYRDILGFERVEALMEWAVPGGPLTMEKPGTDIHLALFEREANPNTSAIAFGASGEEFLEWKSHLEDQGLELRIADHDLAWSLYFTDPYGNMHEITTYDHALVSRKLD
jgi:catechol-2,3-dioxygenase